MKKKYCVEIGHSITRIKRYIIVADSEDDALEKGVERLEKKHVGDNLTIGDSTVSELTRIL